MVPQSNPIACRYVADASGMHLIEEPIWLPRQRSFIVHCTMNEGERWASLFTLGERLHRLPTDCLLAPRGDGPAERAIDELVRLELLEPIADACLSYAGRPCPFGLCRVRLVEHGQQQPAACLVNGLLGLLLVLV